MALANGVVSSSSANGTIIYGQIVTPQLYRPVRFLSSEGTGNGTIIIENTFGYSNTEPIVMAETDKTIPDSVAQIGQNLQNKPASVQVLNTALSSVSGAGGAEAWIS